MNSSPNLGIITLIAAMSHNTFAFDINPFKTLDGKRQFVLNGEQGAGIVASIIINPVHEELTVKSLNLLKTKKLAGAEFINNDLIGKVISGVRWNDDPLNLLPDHPQEWLLNFEHASKLANWMDRDFDLFYRSHHYDLQFLHAMAATDAETAQQTLNGVMTWLEFTYKVSTGLIPINSRFYDLKRYLTPKAARLFKQHFNQNGRRLNWTPAYLFSLKCNREVTLPNYSFAKLDCSKTSWLTKKANIQNIALGSLLHVIQDSFSDSHVTRDPQYEGSFSLIYGRSAIKTFNAYNKQSINLHRGADSYPKDFEEHPKKPGFNLDEESAKLVSKVLYDRHSPKRNNQWHQVSAALKNGLFKIVDKNALAGSGKYK